MIADKRIEDFTKEIKTTSTRVELDNVEIVPNEGDHISLLLPAAIEVRQRALIFQLRVPTSAVLPDAVKPYFPHNHSGPVTFKPGNGFSISACTTDGLTVQLEDVIPFASITSQLPGPNSYEVNFHKINLVPTGFDCMNTAQLKEALRAVQKSEETISIEGEKEGAESSPNHGSDEIFALIPNVTLVIRNNGTETTTQHPFYGKRDQSSLNCFIGELGGGIFCLENSECGDLSISYKRPVNLVGQPTLKSVFEGLLSAIGYTHGCHAWPYYFQHREDHRVVERWLKAPKDCRRDVLLPVPDGNLHYCGQELFLEAAAFFVSATDDANFYEKALWLMREGNPQGMALEVRLLTLCSILEGVVKRYTPSGKQIGDEKAWKAAIQKTGLSWDSWFNEVYNSWKYYRNALAHGFDRPSEDEDSIEIIKAYSRVSAAVYILIAKQMGFSGSMQTSMLEHAKTVSLAR